MDFSALLAQADRAVLGLGGPVRYESSAGEVVELRGVFDAAHQLVDADRPGVTSSAPAVFLRLSDLVAPGGQVIDPEEDLNPTVTVAGVAYLVKSIEKDGQGGVMLRLAEAG